MGLKEMITNLGSFYCFINKGQNYWALIGWERGHFFLIEGIFSNQERAWLPVNDWLIRCIILPFIDKQVIPWDLVLLRINCTWVFKILKTLMQLILNSTWPHVITYTNKFSLSIWKEMCTKEYGENRYWCQGVQG